MVDFFSIVTALTPCLAGVAGLLLLLYLYLTSQHDFFRKLGVPGPKPGLMGIIDNYKKEGIIQTDINLVKKYGRVVGIYHAQIPIMLVSDPEMIKQICVKNFSNFTNRKRPEPISKVFQSAVSVVEDDHWKFSRSALSPTFSSGKMRQMVGLIQTCLDRLVVNLRKGCDKGTSVEINKLMGCFTMDVIASTGFGMDVDSQGDPDNPFVKNAELTMKPTTRLPFIISFLFPFMRTVFEKLRITFMPRQCQKFFFEAMNDVIDSRRKKPSSRPDSLQLMLNTHKLENKMEEDDDPNAAVDFSKIKKRPLTNDEIMSNSVVFMLAGYETTATALSFAMYLMAVNEECQERLVQEIRENIGESSATYDNVMKLPYLDRIFKETLRMYPPASRFSRMAANDIVIEGQLIPAGTSVNFPIYVLHHDPEFWEDPETFNPDRFLPENKRDIHDYCFAPFGIGPRNCIAMRLAILEFKMALVTILQNFRLCTAPDTEIPPKLEKGGFVRAQNGIYLRLEERGAM